MTLFHTVVSTRFSGSEALSLTERQADLVQTPANTPLVQHAADTVQFGNDAMVEPPELRYPTMDSITQMLKKSTPEGMGQVILNARSFATDELSERWGLLKSALKKKPHKALEDIKNPFMKSYWEMQDNLDKTGQDMVYLFQKANPKALFVGASTGTVWLLLWNLFISRFRDFPQGLAVSAVGFAVAWGVTIAQEMKKQWQALRAIE